MYIQTADVNNYLQSLLIITGFQSSQQSCSCRYPCSGSVETCFGTLSVKFHNLFRTYSTWMEFRTFQGLKNGNNKFQETLTATSKRTPKP